MKFQRIIKYGAICLGTVIIVNIILTIFSMIFSMNIFFSSNDNISKDLFNIEAEINEKLNIKLNASELVLKTGNEFNIATNNKKISIKEENNTLYIFDKNKYFNNKNSKLIVTIPKNFTFSLLDIESGAGAVEIDSIACNIFELELGAGKTEINNLFVSSKTDIEGGAGKIDILNSELNNLSLDLGVGSSNIHSRLVGNNKIDSGVGEVNLDLIGNSSDYMIHTSKGIGSIKINHVNVKDDTIFGEGINKVNISGGVGEIKILFK